MEPTTESLPAGPERGGGYVYRVYVSRMARGGTNPATLYRHECYSLARAPLEESGDVYHRPARERFYLHREDAEAVVEKHEPDAPECLDALGLDRSATEADVRNAFRAQSKELHPDHGGDAAAFRRLRDAYEDALETV